MSHGFTSREGWFVDKEGRHALLRGVNLSGASKVPFRPDGTTRFGVDFEGWKDVSFVGRPFPLDEADRHLDRIAHWGFNVLRLLVTWEAIEHAAPGVYDEPYLDYVREVVRRARERGLLVFVDPHHDVWSRWTGGDGAPFWCFEWAGLLPERFVEAEAVELDALDWPSNYQRVPVATMWTLFFGGDAFLPELRGVQRRLQDHYIRAVSALAERLADLDNVLGYDTLNEPSGGYIGRGEDLARGVRSFGSGPDPFSPLEHLAAADGIEVRHEDRILNPKGVSIWRDGCPWRRAGVWDLDGRGRPILRRPDHFRTANGSVVNAWSDFMVPFVRRMRDALRQAHPGCFLFIEGAPADFDTPWQDPDPLVCNARHWYDIVTLAGRRFDPETFRTLGGEVLKGVPAIAEHFAAQLAFLRRISVERMGDPPMLIGEFGTPYEMNGAEAHRTGDYGKPEAHLDACYRALEAGLISSTQWNYTPDNTHALGDRWNQEDLSIFSTDDGDDPADLDRGGRGVRMFCRPYVIRASGRPAGMAFDPESARFELEIDADPAVSAPTVLYVPRLHYPRGVRAEVSRGAVRHDPTRQRLEWDTESAAGRLRLELRPA